MAERAGSEQRSLGGFMLKSSFGTFGSRIFGLLRDMVTGWYWGASGSAQAAITVAFAIPNHLRALFGEGAFTAAFVPMLSERLARRQPAAAWKLAERAISLQLVVLSFFVVAFALVSLVCHVFQPAGLPGHIRLTLIILPLMMPYALFICLTGAFSAVLNSLRIFAWPALVPILYNLVQIGTVIGLCAQWSNTDFAPLLIFCGGALLAGLLQLLAMMLLARHHGFTYHFDLAWDGEVRVLCRNILPGLVGLGAQQFNQLIDKGWGMFLGAQAIGALNYSQHLVYLPVGLFGAAMGTASLPSFSASWARNDRQGLAQTLAYALRQNLFMALPCAALLWVLGEPVITLLLRRGAFDAEAVRQCAWALKFYLLGLPAFCCIKVAAAVFFARQDTRTPRNVTLVCVAANMVLNTLCLTPLHFGGLALSTSLCAFANVVLLLHLNVRSMPEWQPYQRGVINAALALTLAALAASGAAIAGLQVLAWGAGGAGGAGWPYALAQLLAGGGPGLVVYLLACLLLRRPEPGELAGILRRRRRVAPSASSEA